MIRIIIADDHLMFIDGLKSLLRTMKNIQVTGEAVNGRQLIDLLEKTPADLILMDVNMPVMDGADATRLIRIKYPDIKILMLTMFNTRDHIEKLLRAGAHGYILKNTGKKELQDAIESLMKNRSFFSKEVTERIMEGLQKKRSADKISLAAELTEREKDVLRLIAQELTTQEIADKLFLSFHTIETHRKNLISKLNVRNTAGLVKYAVQQGYVD